MVWNTRMESCISTLNNNIEPNKERTQNERLVKEILTPWEKIKRDTIYYNKKDMSGKLVTGAIQFIDEKTSETMSLIEEFRKDGLEKNESYDGESIDNILFRMKKVLAALDSKKRMLENYQRDKKLGTNFSGDLNKLTEAIDQLKSDIRCYMLIIKAHKKHSGLIGVIKEVSG